MPKTWDPAAVTPERLQAARDEIEARRRALVIERVIGIRRANPHWTLRDIAGYLGLPAAYVERVLTAQSAVREPGQRPPVTMPWP